MGVEIVARRCGGGREGVCTVEDGESKVIKSAVDEKDGKCKAGAITCGCGGIPTEYQRCWRREEVSEDELEGGGAKGEEIWRRFGAASTRNHCGESVGKLEVEFGRRWKGDDHEAVRLSKSSFPGGNVLKKTAKIGKNE